MIGLRSVSKILGRPGFRKPVLVDVTATFERDRRYVIFGRKGAGKTTLLKVISGAMPPTEGRVLREGRVSPPLGTAAAIDGNKTGRQLASLVAGLYDADAAEVARFVADFGDMSDWLDVPVATLPGPARMRLAYALGYATPCDFYLVDEHLGYGEQWFRRACQGAFEERRKHSATIVVVREERGALELGEWGGVLHDGRLHMVGSVQDALDYYRTLDAGGVGTSSGSAADMAEAMQRRRAAAAQSAARDGRWEEALALAREALLGAPEDREALGVLAAAAGRLGMDDEAAEAHVGLANGVDNGNLRAALRIYSRAGQWERVLATIDSVRDADDSEFLLAQKFHALCEVGDVERAGRAFDMLAGIGIDKALKALTLRPGTTDLVATMVPRLPEGAAAQAVDRRLVDALQTTMLFAATKAAEQGDAVGAARLLRAAEVLGADGKRRAAIARRAGLADDGGTAAAEP